MSGHFTKRAKQYRFSRESIAFLILCAILVALLAVFFNTIVFAQDTRPDNAVGHYTKDGETRWLVPGDGSGAVDLRGLKTSDIEKLYPMSPEAEAAIVHPPLNRPVIVDGVRYEGNQISLLNGHRLYFVVGKDGNLYAFTTAEGFEKFQAGYSTEMAPMSQGPESSFYADWWYSGFCLYLYVGGSITNLALNALDNGISSAKASMTASWALLYDYPSFQGDCLAIPGGTDLGELFQWGWNDRASSVRVE